MTAMATLEGSQEPPGSLSRKLNLVSMCQKGPQPYITFTNPHLEEGYSNGHWWIWAPPENTSYSTIVTPQRMHGCHCGYKGRQGHSLFRCYHMLFSGTASKTTGMPPQSDRRYCGYQKQAGSEAGSTFQSHPRSNSVSSPEDERQTWDGEMAHSVTYFLYKHEDPNLLSTVHIKSQVPAAHKAFLMGDCFTGLSQWH